MYWCCCLTIIIAPLVIDSPVEDGVLRFVTSAVYSYAYGVSLIASFLIPIMMTTLFYYDEKTKTPKVLFTQPITSHTYTLGKFCGCFSSTILITLLALVIHVLVPIMVGKPPYFSSEFLTVWGLYVIPGLFYFSACSFLLLIFLKTPMLTAIVPIFYVIFSAEWGASIDYLLRGTDLSLLMKGSTGSLLDMNYLLSNRLLFITLGIVFLLVSVISYSPKQILRR